MLPGLGLEQCWDAGRGRQVCSLSDLSDEEVLSPLQKVSGASQGLLVKAGLIPLHLEQHCRSECCLFLQAVCRSSPSKKCTLMQCYCGV